MKPRWTFSMAGFKAAVSSNERQPPPVTLPKLKFLEDARDVEAVTGNGCSGMNETHEQSGRTRE